MKTLFILLISLLGSFSGMAQNAMVTTTIAVKGNCDDCKKRIENAADIKGVRFSEWNEVTQVITVTFKPDKVSLGQIEKAIAASGHDTGILKSDLRSYDKLPACCKYRDKDCENSKK